MGDIVRFPLVPDRTQLEIKVEKAGYADKWNFR